MAKRIVKLGKSIKWTDEQLTQLVNIGPVDIEAAAAWWQAYAPNRFKNLLDATSIIEDMDAGTN